MANLTIGQPGIGSGNIDELNIDKIVPGEHIGYYACKWLWQFHPLGGKLVEKPIKMAMSLPRDYRIDRDPDNRVSLKFHETWHAINATKKISELFYISRCYGAGSLGIGDKTKRPDEELGSLFDLRPENLFINIFDPLNTSGSVVTSQDPNTQTFQAADKWININSVYWHPSRTCTVFNGTPIYLAYQPSAYGYTGQSVFQRILTPMKSFLNTIETDHMISRKAGLLVAKTFQNTSTASGLMQKAGLFKRMLLKVAGVNEVLQIGPQDSIESLDLGNLEKSYGMARDNIIANISTGSDVPAILLKEESFTHGFGEGTEDAKAIAHYIDGIRQQLYPVVKYIENIVTYLAWTPEFYEEMKRNYPEEFKDDYLTTFYGWKDSFESDWRSLLETSPEKQRESDARKIERAGQVAAVILEKADQVNAARTVMWLSEVVNSTKSYKDAPLYLDEDLLETYVPSELEGPP